MSVQATFRPNEKRLMRQLLRLAVSGSNPWPNPHTAAAVVQHTTVVGIGRHHAPGEPHAEVMALRDAGSAAKGGTLMVTLEPCTHFGRTPPCVEAIVQAGIREVIYAVSDPNPLVKAGQATAYLQSHGVLVRQGLYAREAAAINAAFMKRFSHREPFVTLKAGTSLDGKIALKTGESTYITGPASREYVHRLRAQQDVICVGIGTVLADNPRLTVRLQTEMPQPAILILDPHAKTPSDAKLFEGRGKDEILIVVSPNAITSHLERRATCIVVPESTDQSRISWTTILGICKSKEWYRVLIEGGETVFSSALDADVVDYVVWCVAPVLLGGKHSFSAYAGLGVPHLGAAKHLVLPKTHRAGRDTVIEGFLHDPLVLATD